MEPKKSLVIDNGSGIMKVGFAGEAKPSVIFPTYVGRLKRQKLLSSKGESAELFIGSKVESNKTQLKLKYPIEHGIVKDWADMKAIWSEAYNCMKSKPQDHPVLLTEAILNPYSNREKAAEIFFESFNVPAIFICSQALLSLYASGQMTGVVLDCGDGVCQCAPVYDGFILNSAQQRINLGGCNVNSYLNMLLRRAGYIFHTSADLEIIRQIKEKYCVVHQTAGGPEKEVKDRESILKDLKKPLKYTLPDNSELLVGEEKFLAPEILFYPEKVGLELPGVHDLLFSSIDKADIDLKKDLYESIHISGAGSKFPGFATRIFNEIQDKTKENIKLKIFAPSDREFSCWRGGSILSSLESFNEMLISKKEIAEQGSRILHKKAF